MSEHVEYVITSEKEHKARILIGDPQAEAYEWIRNYAENLTAQCQPDRDYDEDENNYREYHDGVSMEDLIYTGMSQLENGWGDYITRGGVFEGQGTDPTFWDKLAILKGIDIPSDKRNNFFSCSC